MKRQAAWGLLFLMLSINVWGQEKQKGEVNLIGGYGNVTPYAMRLKFNLEEGKFVFNPFIGVKGITHESSGQIRDEAYMFTGRMPLSETAGSRYFSHKTTEARGTLSDYGFQATYRPTPHQTLVLGLCGENASRNEQGWLGEQLLNADGGQLAKTQWRLESPKFSSTKWKVNAGYTFSFEHADIGISYKYFRDYEETDQRMDLVRAEGFADFSNSLATSDATTQHHDVRLSFNHRAQWGDLRLVARYESQLMKSEDQQWLDQKLCLNSHFCHQYHTTAASFLYSVRPDKRKRLELVTGLEFAYTDMEGRKLHDYLPSAHIGWHVGKNVLLALNYKRRLLRPSLSQLNPASIRDPFATRQGNNKLEGMHPSALSLDFTHRLSLLQWHLCISHIFTNDAFNGIWKERSNHRYYQWGNEGKRRAWSIAPDFSIHASRSTRVEGKFVVIWDKRIADAISLKEENWGITSRLEVEQILPFNVQAKAFGEYSEGNKIDLYRHMGKSYALGAKLAKRFGEHFQVRLQYQYNRFGNEILTEGAYTGSYFLRSKHRNACTLALSYKF